MSPKEIHLIFKTDMIMMFSGAVSWLFAKCAKYGEDNPSDAVLRGCLILLVVPESLDIGPFITRTMGHQKCCAMLDHGIGKSIFEVQ